MSWIGNYLAEQEARKREQYATTDLAAAGLPYVDPGSKHYASEMAAAVQRAEWEDYKRRFRPVENELMGSIGNPQVLNDALARGQQAVSTSFDTSAGVMQRGLSRLGVAMNPAEQAASDRSLSLEQARTGAAVDNMTRRNVKDRDLAIMGGGGLAMRADAKEIWK